MINVKDSSFSGEGIFPEQRTAVWISTHSDGLLELSCTSFDEIKSLIECGANTFFDLWKRESQMPLRVLVVPCTFELPSVSEIKYIVSHVFVLITIQVSLDIEELMLLGLVIPSNLEAKRFAVIDDIVSEGVTPCLDHGDNSHHFNLLMQDVGFDDCRLVAERESTI